MTLFNYSFRSVSVCLILSCLAACENSHDNLSKTVIDGNWTTVCLPVAAGSGGSQKQSRRVIYSFTTEHRVTRTEYGYSDADCQDLSERIEHEGSFALEVLAAVSVYNIDLTFERIQATPLTKSLSAAWNAEAFCGSNQWEAGAAQSVLGQAADACQSFGVQKIEYRDLVQISKDQLRFGNVLNNSIPRPTSIGMESPERSFLLTGP